MNQPETEKYFRLKEQLMISGANPDITIIKNCHGGGSPVVTDNGLNGGRS